MATYTSMPWQYQQPIAQPEQPMPGLPPIVQGPALTVGPALQRVGQAYDPNSFTTGGQPATPSPWVSVPGSAFPNAGMEYQTADTKTPPLPLGNGGVVTPPPKGGLPTPALPLGNGGVTTPTPGLNSGGNDWYNQIPEWTQGGGYQYGWDFNQQTGTWTPKGPQAKGSIIGAEVGWKTPLYLPVAYNPAADTFRAEYGKTGGETAIARAIRQTADYARAHPGTNAQHYFEYVLASLSTQNQGTGLDSSQFNPVGYGTAYDPNAVYTRGNNPWTGKPNGNATGQPGVVPGAANATPGAPPPPPAPPPAPPVAPPPAPPGQEASPMADDKDKDPTAKAGATQYGGVTLDDPLFSTQGFSQDPVMAGRFLRQAQGLGGHATSRMGKLRDQFYGKMLAAYLNLSGTAGNAAGNMPTDLGTFFQALQGGNILPAIQAQARTALGAGTGGLDDAQMEQLLGYGTALAGVGKGSIGQAGLDFGLEDLLNSQMDEDYTSGGADVTPLYKRYQNSPYKSALDRYLAIVGH